jgi:nucleoside-diphosphate-sugar epimerase
MNVFITGGSGYIGRSTIPLLIRRGFGVTALARSSSSANVVAELGATPVRGALTDLGVLRSAAAGADSVLHLGADHGGDTAAVDLAAAAAMQDGLGGRGAYVHTGGVWVYGHTDGVVDESAAQSPPAIVAWRAANERQVLARGGRLVMPGVVYGRSAGLVEMFLAAPGRSDGAVPRIGDGANRWSVVHVDDVAELYALALEAPAGSVYAGVSEFVSLASIAGAVAASVGMPVAELDQAAAQERMGPIAEAFALDQRVSGERARSELGWAPVHVDALRTLGAHAAV